MNTLADEIKKVALLGCAAVSAGAVTTAEAPAAPQAGAQALTERAKSERRLAAMLVGPAAIVMAAVIAYPVIDAVVLSLQRSDLRYPGATKFIGLANYGHVLSAPVWWQDVRTRRSSPSSP